MPSAIQPSFAKGQLDTSLHGRVDTSAYHVGLALARNVIIHATGGASNRPGTVFIGPCKTHTDGNSPRLIEFEFKTSDQYTLEFGDAYMRVVRNDGHVVESTTTITAATKANPVVVTTSAGHGYENGDEVFITGVVGMTEINDQRFVVANKAAATFELTHQVTGANIDGLAFTAYTSGGTAARVYTLTTPYAIADVPLLKFVQSADTMTITHPDYQEKELTRTAHDAWTLSDISFVPDIGHTDNIAITVNSAGTTTYKYFVTAVHKDTGEESMPGLSDAAAHTITAVTKANPAVVTVSGAHNLESGDIVHISGIVGMTELNGRHFTIADVPSGTTFELSNEDSTNYTAWASAGTADEAFEVTALAHATVPDNSLVWDSVLTAGRYNVYRRRGDEPLGFIGDTVSLNFDDNSIIEDTGATPPLPRNPFLASGDSPGTVSYYQQRRIFAGSTNFPDTFHLSQTAGHNNFSVAFPSAADDAITATLNARKVNEIRHFVPGNDLLCFTSGSEWRIHSGDNSGFAADTMQVRPQTRWGCSHIPPVDAGENVLYITDSGAMVRSIEFEATRAGYGGTNLSELAAELLETHVATDWAFTRDPEGRAYIVRADGQVLTMTYNPTQEVVAWTTWDTDGKFESAAVKHKGASTSEDTILYVVKRTINGNTVRYIERTHSRIFDTVEDCFFVDSGLSLDAPITITGATAANPVVITAASHGLSNGDEVILSDITWVSTFDASFNETQPDQLNGGKYIVANQTANTFELTSTVDGSNIDGSAFDAYVEGGNVRLTVTSISGLRHLEAATVVALLDGNVVTNLTVSATGTVTLPFSAGRVHVGLRYISDIETLNIENPKGTIQGKNKKIAEVTIRFKKSRGLLVGPNSAQLVEMKQREFEAYGEPTQLLTGDKAVKIKPKWQTNGRIFMRQKDPLPMTILAVMPTMSVTG